MTPSPLLFRMTLVTSISVLTAGVAWSAYEAHEKQTALNSSKGKAVRAKTPKPKQTFVKAVSSNSETGNVKLISSQQLSTPKQADSQAAGSSEPAQYVPAAAIEVSQNPYFANQPAAILPLAARPVATNPTPRPIDVAPVASAPAITPAVVAPVVIGPASTPAIEPVSAPTIAIPAPSVASVASVAAAPVAPALPSLAPPIYSAASPVATNSYSAPVAAYQTWNSASTGINSPSANPYLNPYLNNNRAYQPQPPAAAPVQPFIPSFSNPFGGGAFKFSLPSLPSFPSLPQAGNPEPAAYKAPQFSAQQIQTPKKAASTGSGSSILSSLKMMIPLTGDSNILPTIKKVYPTGEKPLVVLNFKCPTEVIGITPPPMKLLHEAVNFGFDGLNKTNLLSFNLQQVCS